MGSNTYSSLVNGVTTDDLLAKFRDISGNILATADDMFANVMSAKAVYVSNSAITLSSLLSTFPASATMLNMYARVSDLYGSVDDIMRCRWDGTNYRWVPQRESFAGNNATTSGTLTLTPLVTPPTLRLSGTLTGNINATPSTTNAYIGQRFRIVNNAVLSIFTASITGLIGTNLTVLGGGSRDIEYGSGGWFAAT